ncbi:hypothetical protein FHS16_002604 [Paenibacillus endophyticus]|uniref:Uncharacterized protein n=1 Tax=Paenibacillus endophyticus TaxID=1294268 RepID=A0A7W5C9C5_9BACL|nr:hypothetical protein [Paenibacillus endophyticus]
MRTISHDTPNSKSEIFSPFIEMAPFDTSSRV